MAEGITRKPPLKQKGHNRATSLPQMGKKGEEGRGGLRGSYILKRREGANGTTCEGTALALGSRKPISLAQGASWPRTKLHYNYGRQNSQNNAVK